MELNFDQCCPIHTFKTGAFIISILETHALAPANSVLSENEMRTAHKQHGINCNINFQWVYHFAGGL